MRFSLFLFACCISTFLKAQDTVFFKIEPAKPHVVKSIRYDTDYAYLLNLSGDTEARVDKNEILKVRFFDPAKNPPVINDSLRTEEYCIVVGTAQLFSTKVKITVDFGQEENYWKGTDYIRSQTGDVVKFNSMVDALNYMNALGWEFVSAYPMTSNQGSCYHYLMRRKIKQK